MTQIDINKFICSFMKYPVYGASDNIEEIRESIQLSLKEQGLEYKDGDIVSIEPEPKQDTSELTEFEKELCILVNSYDDYQNEEQDKFFNKQRDKLLSIARKQLQPEFDKELELAYKNQDEVVYNRGYDKGREDERKEKVDDLISKDDIEQLVGEYQYDGHPCDFQVKAYKQGIERVVEFIKEK